MGRGSVACVRPPPEKGEGGGKESNAVETHLELDELDDLSVDTTTEALVGSDWDHDLGLGVEFDAVGVLLRLLNGPKKVLRYTSPSAT